MRISLYEKLKQQQISFIDEIAKINSIVYNFYSSNLSTFSKIFKESPFATFFVSFDSAVTSMLYADGHKYYMVNDNEQLIQQIQQQGRNLSLDCFLDFLEFYKTLLPLVKHPYNTDFTQINNIVDHDCNILGYKFIEDKNTKIYRVMLKNPVAEAVAINSKAEIRDKIYEYLTIRVGNIEAKRNCLKSLADDVELALKNINITEFVKVRQFIQCVRHTKDTPKKEFPFYYENEEEWLDKTFEMVIGVLAFENAKEITKEIKELENTN